MTPATIVTIVLVSAIAFAMLLVALVERRSEDATIRRLLRQRDQARARIDVYRREMKMRSGEFLPHAEDDEP